MMPIVSKIFLDSNILIYLYTSDEIQKTAKIQNVLKIYEDILISTQVLFEFSYVSHRKLKLDYSSIEKALKEFKAGFELVTITYDMLLHALKIASKYRYSFPDSLIIATAIESGCDILFSEDMHNTQVVEDKLKIVSPFV